MQAEDPGSIPSHAINDRPRNCHTLVIQLPGGPVVTVNGMSVTFAVAQSSPQPPFQPQLQYS